MNLARVCRCSGVSTWAASSSALLNTLRTLVDERRDLAAQLLDSGTVDGVCSEGFHASVV
jgi:hypothetical protein